MKPRRYYRELLIGATTLGFALLTALATDDRRIAGVREGAVATGADAASEVVTWDLPATRNERVDEFIDLLSREHHTRTSLWIARSGRYEAMIRGKLRERGMPEDLLYLAFIESGFSPKAYSPARASGLWQFIAETGRRYGLEVTSYVDERRDPVASTDAALDYLQELHDRFGSWYLAAAAYNSGENRIERLLDRYAHGAKGSDSLYWKISPHLPRETRDYVPLMLAAGFVGKERAKYGFDDVVPHEPLEYDSVLVAGGTRLKSVAAAAGVDADTVEYLNAHLVRKMTPPGKAYPVRLPTGHLKTFAANFTRMVQQERVAVAEVARERSAMRTHTVRRGETLGGIARKYGVSVSALRQANSVNARRLQIGQKVRIPGGSVRVASATTRSSGSTDFYRVRRGDTLSEIAQRHDVSVRALQRWNGLGRRSTIRPGQRLRVDA